MFATDLISPNVPVLSPKDKIGETLRLMNKTKTRHLPVVSGSKYIGLAEELKLIETKAEQMLLSDLSDSLQRFAIQTEAHFFDVLKTMKDYRLDVLPIIDKSKRYSGTITTNYLLHAIGQLNSFSHEGSMLVLKMNESDYMLSGIAAAAEGEDISLLGVHTMKEVSTGVFQVLLKTNRGNLDSFITSLKYLGYEVTYRFDKQEDKEGIHQNYEHLINYINM